MRRLFLSSLILSVLDPPGTYSAVPFFGNEKVAHTQYVPALSRANFFSMPPCSILLQGLPLLPTTRVTGNNNGNLYCAPCSFILRRHIGSPCLTASCLAISLQGLWSVHRESSINLPYCLAESELKCMKWWRNVGSFPEK